MNVYTQVNSSKVQEHVFHTRTLCEWWRITAHIQVHRLSVWVIAQLSDWPLCTPKCMSLVVSETSRNHRNGLPSVELDFLCRLTRFCTIFCFIHKRLITSRCSVHHSTDMAIFVANSWDVDAVRDPFTRRKSNLFKGVGSCLFSK